MVTEPSEPIEPKGVPEPALRRLAFIRYLHTLGVRQSYQPEPASAVSLLMFQDCIELFLHLAAENLNVKVKDATFMQYFERIDTAVSPQQLAHREAVRRLNDARVHLKHRGSLPARIDIEGFRGTCTSFLEDNTPLLFHMRFRDISLANIISVPQARDAVVRAEAYMAAGQKGDAAEQLALGFAWLERAPLDLMRYRDRAPFLRRISRDEIEAKSFTLERYFEAVNKSIEQLRHQVQQLSLGFDPHALTLFRQLTPSVALAMSGVHESWRSARDEEISERDLQFCYDFVIESALQVQRQLSMLTDKQVERTE